MFARTSRTLAACLIVAAAACSDSPTAPRADQEFQPLFSHTADLGGVHVYTFDTCESEDLVFSVDVQGLCATGPSGPALLIFPPDEVTLQLPAPATSVTISMTAAAPPSATFVAYAGGERLTADAAFAQPPMAEILTIDAPAGTTITAVGFMGFAFVDDLEVTYQGVSNDPATKDDCKNGGWEAFGFRNQGQCVRFVNTGEDSR